MLTTREIELVCISAAVGSNCMPCVKDHLAQSQQVGVSSEDLREAIRLAERVKESTARQVTDSTHELLGWKDSVLEFLSR